MSPAPILFDWTGESFVPQARFRRVCDAEFVVGEVYRLSVEEERSHKSHAHYMASVGEAWKNLREEDAARFPSPTHLRKWALIEAGFRNEHMIECASNAAAIRAAAIMRGMEEYAVVVVRDKIVRVWTAQSQSRREMGKEAFGKSKQAVLEILAGMIEVRPEALEENAGRAA